MSSCPKQLPLAVLATNICGEAQSSLSTSVPQPQPCLLEGNTDLSVIVGHLRDSYSLHHTVCLYTQAVHNQSYGYLSENDNRSSFLFAPLWSAELLQNSSSHFSNKWQNKYNSSEEPGRLHQLQRIVRSMQIYLLGVWKAAVDSQLEGITSLSELILTLWCSEMTLW